MAILFTKKPQSAVVALLWFEVMIIRAGINAESAVDPLDCKAPYVAHEHTEVDVCSMLYQKFESALTVPSNLYKLRHTFFPNMRADPMVVNIVYQLMFLTNQTNLCTDALRHNEDKGLEAINSTTELIWTSSVTLSIIDPQIFNYFQPTFLITFGPLIEDQNRVVIPLKISDKLPCIPTEEQVLHMLNDLTANVSY